MSLKEDFEHPENQSVGHDFGDEPDTTGKQALGDKKFGETALDDDDVFGVPKIDLPDDYGYDSAMDTASDFVDSSDEAEDDDLDMAIDDMYSEEADIDESDDEITFNIREAVEFILSTLDEEEYEPNGDSVDDGIDNEGVDTNTIVPHNSEEDQFSASEDVDNELEESVTGWADLL